MVVLSLFLLIPALFVAVLSPKLTASQTIQSPMAASTNVANFGGSIFLGGPWDWMPNVDGENTASRCMRGLENLQEAGITKVRLCLSACIPVAFDVGVSMLTLLF